MALEGILLLDLNIGKPRWGAQLEFLGVTVRYLAAENARGAPVYLT